MTNNLNESLYKRFGLEMKLEEVQVGFIKHLKNLLAEDLAPFVYTENYDEKEELDKNKRAFLKEACRQMFLDFDDFDSNYLDFSRFIRNIFDPFTNFDEFLINLQILLNIIFKYKIMRHETDELSKHISEYLEDYPILGLNLKIYKTKSPQLLPSISKFSNKEIENTLGLLEAEKYSDVLDAFQDGLKEFLLAKNKSQLKNTIEDMCTACDELVKVILNDKNKGFKHVFSKDNYRQFGFKNKNSKEIYRNLKDWMDGIKHGTIKSFDREDTEMIISLVGSFIRFAVNVKK
jgi:hypothetical protein